MDAHTSQAIEKSKGRLAWLEKRLADLEVHRATLPSVGCHRSEFLRTQRVIQFVKETLEKERDQMKWLREEALQAEEFEKLFGKIELTEEQEKAYAEYQKEDVTRQKERERREVEAEQRRAQFRVIPGGRG